MRSLRSSGRNLLVVTNIRFLFLQQSKTRQTMSRLFSRIPSMVLHAQNISWKHKWQTQAQQQTTDGYIDNDTLPASCSHPFSFRCWKFVTCGVVHACLLQTNQLGLPLARGSRALCISCMLGRQMVSKTCRTPVVTHFTSTVNAFLFFINLRLVSVCHPQLYCSIASRFHKLIDYHRTCTRSSPLEKMCGIKRNMR